MRAQFIASETITGLRRNLAMTISVVIVTLVSLVFVGMALLFQSQVSAMKGYWYDKVQVSIFLCSKDSLGPTCPAGEVTQIQRDEIAADLKSETLKPYVEKYYYVSKSEAYQRFKEQFADSALKDTVTEDQMPESFRIKLVKAEEYKVIAQTFQGRIGIEQIKDEREILDKLFRILNTFTFIALAVAAVMVIAAVLLITTTIKLSAHNRRRETSIMRLVGASAMTIQLPFLLEAVISAFVGAALAVGVLWVTVHYGVGWLSANMSSFKYVTVADIVWPIGPVLLLTAVGLAAVSSIFSISRYLKV